MQQKKIKFKYSIFAHVTCVTFRYMPQNMPPPPTRRTVSENPLKTLPGTVISRICPFVNWPEFEM